LVFRQFPMNNSCRVGLSNLMAAGNNYCKCHWVKMTGLQIEDSQLAKMSKKGYTSPSDMCPYCANIADFLAFSSVVSSRLLIFWLCCFSTMLWNWSMTVLLSEMKSMPLCEPNQPSPYFSAASVSVSDHFHINMICFINFRWKQSFFSALSLE